MKRILALLLFSSLCMGLTACSQWVKNDYSVITPHIEQPLPEQDATQEEAPLVVSNRTELRGAMLSLIRDWAERGTIFVRSYDSEIVEDLQETVLYSTREDPIGAYAVDYVDAEYNGIDRISVSIVYRRSSAEVDSIVTVNGNTSARAKIQQALESFDSSLTLRIRNYQEMDFAQFIYNYSLQNPGTVVALPTVSAEVYPKEGQTRILELHFSYPFTRDEMRLMQTSVNTILSSASSYIRSGEDDLQQAQLLYRFLTSRFRYSLSTESPAAPAYSLLCKGEAHSLSFSTVFYAECQAADLDCLIVSGYKDGVQYYWNLLQIEGEYYHVDLMRSISQSESELCLLYSEELLHENYEWDKTQYPITAVRETEPTQPSIDATEPPSQNPEESTEPSTEESSQPSSEEANSEQETSSAEESLPPP